MAEENLRNDSKGPVGNKKKDPDSTVVEGALLTVLQKWLGLAGFVAAIRELRKSPLRNASVLKDTGNLGVAAAIQLLTPTLAETLKGMYDGDVHAAALGVKKALESLSYSDGSWSRHLRLKSGLLKHGELKEDLPGMFAMWLIDDANGGNLRRVLRRYRSAGNDIGDPDASVQFSRRIPERSAVKLKENVGSNWSGPSADKNFHDAVWAELHEALLTGKDVVGRVVDITSEELGRPKMRRKHPRGGTGAKSGTFLVTHIAGRTVYSDQNLADIINNPEVQGASPYMFTYDSSEVELADTNKSHSFEMQVGLPYRLTSPVALATTGKRRTTSNELPQTLTFIVGEPAVPEKHMVIKPEELGKFLLFGATTFVNAEISKAKREQTESDMSPEEGDDDSETESHLEERQQKEFSEGLEDNTARSYGTDAEMALAKEFKATRDLATLDARRREADNPVRSVNPELSGKKNRLLNWAQGTKTEVEKAERELEGSLSKAVVDEIKKRPSLDILLAGYRREAQDGSLEKLVGSIVHSREYLLTMVKYLPDLKPPNMEVSYKATKEQQVFLKALLDEDDAKVKELLKGGVEKLFSASVQRNPEMLQLVKDYSLSVLSGRQYKRLVMPYVYPMVIASLEGVLKDAADKYSRDGKEKEFIDNLVGGANWMKDNRSQARKLQVVLQQDDYTSVHEKLKSFKSMFAANTRLMNTAWDEVQNILQEIVFNALSHLKTPEVGDIGAEGVGAWESLQDAATVGRSRGSGGGVDTEGKRRYASEGAPAENATADRDVGNTMLAIKMASAKLFNKVS